ncbi:uncharacterized protein LOC122506215 isoform X2 [Leptopilina heterotoma]|uniref:uncharacterized protein LOC122506215 isoform X2 n=1 Tax=Leptopilina heterotoma TaxID=63436 RepID=UPI001CA7DE87|nr:uncharacterized protein LOC122506215 isoform X2 [Leptopilina heterotoma]
MADYFYKLRERGRMLDEGINNMSKIWSAPHIHVGGHLRYSVNDKNEENLEETAKANTETENLFKFVSESHKNMQKDMRESEKNLEEMQKFINDSKSVCDDLIQQCSDIETLFVENGYVPLKEEEEEENSSPKSEPTTNFENSYVSSTPYNPWKSKLKTFDASTPTEMKVKKEFIEDIQTPLAQKLLTSSILSRQVRPSPREPILSRYFKEL